MDDDKWDGDRPEFDKVDGDVVTDGDSEVGSDITDGVGGIGRSKSGSSFGTGCDTAVVVFRAGAYASASIALQSKGQIPIFQKAL